MEDKQENQAAELFPDQGFGAGEAIDAIGERQTQRGEAYSFPLLPGAFLPWYDKNKRSLPWRQDQEPYHVWLSEIMLQQTRVEAARGYYLRFLAALPDLEALARADEELLLKLWEGLGYYNRAKNLQKAARRIVEELGGRFPSTFEGLMSLPGVGDYTAGAIGSICFDLPTPALDGNVLRLLARIGADDTPLEKPSLKKRLREGLARVYPQGRCGDFTQALIEAGALLCLPKGAPRCADCPATGFCLAYRRGLTAELPVRSGKKERRLEELTVFVLGSPGGLALRKRPPKGLLSSLWELPNVAGRLNPGEAVAAALKLLGDDAAALTLTRTQERSHIFSHVEWRMTCYYFDVGSREERLGLKADFAGELAEDRKPYAAGEKTKAGILPGEALVWATQQQLAEEYALPAAFSQFL